MRPPSQGHLKTESASALIQTHSAEPPTSKSCSQRRRGNVRSTIWLPRTWARCGGAQRPSPPAPQRPHATRARLERAAGEAGVLGAGPHASLSARARSAKRRALQQRPKGCQARGRWRLSCVRVLTGCSPAGDVTRTATDNTGGGESPPAPSLFSTSHSASRWPSGSWTQLF